MIIYKITNNINGKIYIGQTVKSLDERIKQHKRKKDCIMNKTFSKYGFENFTIEQIDVASSIEELNQKEMDYIKTFECLSPKGYNLTSGGLNGKRSLETCLKMSEIKKKQSLETRVKISLSNTGKKRSPTSRAKMSEAAKKRKRTKLSKETKEKISLSHKKGKSNGKSILCVETGQIFKSIVEASEVLKLGESSIRHQIKGRTLQTNNKFTFVYNTLENEREGIR